MLGFIDPSMVTNSWEDKGPMREQEAFCLDRDCCLPHRSASYRSTQICRLMIEKETKKTQTRGTVKERGEEKRLRM